MRTARSPTYPQLGSASRARNSLWEFCFYDSSFLAQAAMMTLPLSRSCRRESTQNRHKGIRAARSRPHESEPSSQVPPRGRNRHGSFGEILRCGFSDSALKARRETHVGNRSRSACWARVGAPPGREPCIRVGSPPTRSLPSRCAPSTLLAIRLLATDRSPWDSL
jgi:hypothetical protein